MIQPYATGRLTLRPLAARDEGAFVHYHQVSFDALSRWSPSLTRETDLIARFRAELDKAEGHAAGQHLKLVAELDGGQLAALVSLTEIVRGAFHNAYAGWSVRSDLTGQGIATEAVGGLLDVAFAPPPVGIGLHRVQANIIPANVASLRVAEKVGLRREGVALRYLHIGGMWQDHVMFALTAEERPRPQEGG